MLCLPVLCLGAPLAADGAKRVFAPGGYALGGVDPVGYFVDGRARMGSEKWKLHWAGALWLFADAASMGTFESNPRRFAPRYGGHCAYAMAHGDVRPVDPAAWAIRDGHLYLTRTPETLAMWQRDPDRYMAMADAVWSRMWR